MTRAPKLKPTLVVVGFNAGGGLRVAQSLARGAADVDSMYIRLYVRQGTRTTVKRGEKTTRMITGDIVVAVAPVVVVVPSCHGGTLVRCHRFYTGEGEQERGSQRWGEADMWMRK